MTTTPDAQHSTARDILALAVPAFLALVAEPIFLLVDSAIVGHLGVPQLAGLGIASALLATASSIFVFLAYATTAVVARQLGAGDRREAAASGVDGLWLSLVLGALTAVVAFALAGPVSALMGASGEVLDYSTQYLRIAAWGIPGMLVGMAVTGVLRGFQDTRTPLAVSVTGFAVNAGLNAWLVYGLDMGVAGSALGTMIAQSGMGLVYLVALLKIARREDAPLAFHPGRVLAAARGGVPLIIRTLALRIILLLTVWDAAALGRVPLAAHQVASNVWSLLSLSLDSLAIAAQALIGKALGAGDVDEVHAILKLMVRWGVRFGAVIGAIVIACSGVLPMVFTPDPDVRAALTAALIVVGLGQPLAGYAFVLDGVLIGAGDGRWLAKAMVIVLIAYLPLIALLRWAGPMLTAWGAPAATAAIWVVFMGFMAVRSVLLGRRARTDDWIVTGAVR